MQLGVCGELAVGREDRAEGGKSGMEKKKGIMGTNSELQ